jgi:hypothetical protein
VYLENYPDNAMELGSFDSSDAVPTRPVLDHLLLVATILLLIVLLR